MAGSPKTLCVRRDPGIPYRKEETPSMVNVFRNVLDPLDYRNNMVIESLLTKWFMFSSSSWYAIFPICLAAELHPPGALCFCFDLVVFVLLPQHTPFIL
jgi:hypothetical protein